MSSRFEDGPQTDLSYNEDPDFWHSGPVVYQIYPRSFRATDGLREGTIAGITEKLGYLKGEKNSLGVDAIWLTPVYKSPMKDGGYDVETYREVNPRFGNIEGLRELINQAHNRELKVMVDFVPNHMSTESEWFKEAVASNDSPKSDWFIFRDPNPDGSPPNNWLSEFREREYDEETGEVKKLPRSVWQWVPERGQYVLCTFTEFQADLNWHNQQVREAMKDEMRFLLDLGVDGFRVDMVTFIGKHPDLPNEPLNLDYNPDASDDPNDIILRKYRNNDPSLYVYMNELVEVLKEYDGRFMITEDYVPRESPVDEYLKYYENVDAKYSAPFSFENFEFMMPCNAKEWKKFYDEFMARTNPDYILTGVLGNHDQSRVASRLGVAVARSLAVVQLTLPGIPFIYYGEELGMEDVDIPKQDQDDPYEDRDKARTPMLWTPGQNAGFTEGINTWLPVSPDYIDKNVETQLMNPDSVLCLYRQLLALRRVSKALRIGSYIPEEAGHTDVFSYSRRSNEEHLTVVVNFSEVEAEVRLCRGLGAVILSSVAEGAGKGHDIEMGEFSLQANEALIIKPIER